MSILTSLKSLFSRASLENPTTTLQDPDVWLFDTVGGRAVDAGVSVTADSALTYAPFWRGVNLICGDVSKLPVSVYRYLDGGGMDEDRQHPAYRIVKRKFNRFLTARTGKEVLQLHCLLYGNGYGLIFRDGAGRPQEISILDPSNTNPVVEGGRLQYVSRILEEDRRLQPENVLHVRGLGDSLCGLNVIEYAKNTLGLGMAAQKFGSKFFGNGAMPGGVLEHPEAISEDAAKRLRKSWEKMHGGVDNASKVAVLEEGLKYSKISVNNNDAQFLESRQFSLIETANILNLPPHKLGGEGHTSYNSLEQENQAYLDQSIDPWLCRFESEFWDKLLSEKEKQDESHTIEFKRQALVRADIKSRADVYASGIAAGWMTRNEVRARENLNPKDGGDELTPALNLAGGNDPDPEQEPEPEGNSLRIEAHRRLLEDTVRRMVTLLDGRAKRAEKKGELEGWLNDGMCANEDTVQEALRGAVDATATHIGRDIKLRLATFDVLTEVALAYQSSDEEPRRAELLQAIPAVLAERWIDGTTVYAD